MWLFRNHRHTFKEFFFLINLWKTNSLKNIIEEQYYLSKKANISITDSTLMPDWEREIYSILLLADIKEETEQIEDIK